MIQYERIDKSEGIDFNKTIGSKECMICHYWYFDTGFKYQPYVCNACHDFKLTVQNVSDFFIATLKMLIIGVILWVLIKMMRLIC